MREVFAVQAAEWLGPTVKRFWVDAPRVARYWSPGQFVIVRVHKGGERIPLTVAHADPERGSIQLIVQGVGKTTRLMNRLVGGDLLADVVGPLGTPSELGRFGTVVVIGGGVGTAIAYPTARALSERRNRIVAILGGRSADLLILETEMAAIADEVRVTTDDGSRGRRGLVTDALADVLDEERVDRVVAIGPVPMMAAVAGMTRDRAIPTIVSLNPIMVDGTGMCGGCRVSIGGATKFACVDGPEFDGHLVDFALLATRNRTYCEFEREQLVAMETGRA